MIYTFYSYKGGVGRSMALANVAKWFYLHGLRVVIVDWDLEAPGLENFFVDRNDRKELRRVQDRTGLIDLLIRYQRRFSALPLPPWSNAFTKVLKSVIPDQLPEPLNDVEIGGLLKALEQSLSPSLRPAFDRLDSASALDTLREILPVPLTGSSTHRDEIIQVLKERFPPTLILPIEKVDARALIETMEETWMSTPLPPSKPESSSDSGEPDVGALLAVVRTNLPPTENPAFDAAYIPPMLTLLEESLPEVLSLSTERDGPSTAKESLETKALTEVLRRVLPSNFVSSVRHEYAKSLLRALEENLPAFSSMLFQIYEGNGSGETPGHAPEEKRPPGLWLLSAGWRFGDRFPVYAQNVQSFDWTSFYNDFQGEAYFEWMRTQLNRFADVVLIDSRTGVTEMGGVCTRQLADVVVSFVATNRQNLDGVVTMVRSFKRNEVSQSRLKWRKLSNTANHEFEVIVVPARVEDGELDLKIDFRNRFRDEFKDTPAPFQKTNTSFWDLRIPYRPKYAYNEILVIGDKGADEELEEAYQDLGMYLAMLAPERSNIRKCFDRDLREAFPDLLPGMTVISYAAGLHEAARDLCIKLEAEGIALRDDLLAIEDGPTSGQGSQGIDPSDSIVIVASDEAATSQPVIRQWLAARRQGKCVYMIGTGLSERPRSPEPNGLPRSAETFCIHSDLMTLTNRLRSPCVANYAPQMAPPPPEQFFAHEADLERLKSILIRSDPMSRQRHVAHAALCGMGGSGKSTLASALSYDDDAQRYFDGGVLWASLGANPDIRGKLTEFYAAITGDRRDFATAEEACVGVAQLLSGQNCLMIVDDVWDKQDLRLFFRAGANCSIVITTRDQGLAAENADVVFLVGEIGLSEAVEIITSKLKLDPGDVGIREQLVTLVERLGRSPLAVELAGAELRRRIEQGDRTTNAIEYLKQLLDVQGVVAFDTPGAEERNLSVARTLALSLERLTEEERTRYSRLAEFPENEEIPLSTIGARWSLDEFRTEQLLQRFSYLSLLSFNLERKTVVLHSLLRSYLIEQAFVTPPSLEESKGDAVFGGDTENVIKARNILRGQSGGKPEDLFKLAMQLKAEKQFGLARRLLIRTRKDPRLNEDKKLFLKTIQQLSLSTRRDVDLPVDERLDLSFEILKETGEDLNKTKDQETLGLAGAVFKNKWEVDGQKQNLERALAYYQRGYHVGVTSDFGYTGINAAYVLDLLADQEVEEAAKAGTSSEYADRRRSEAQSIRADIVTKLPPLANLPNNEWLRKEWWFLVTLAEAFFGLKRYDESLYWLKEAAALRKVPDWEYETTARQLASIARSQSSLSDQLTPNGLKDSKAWEVLRVFLKNDADAVRSTFVGKVGLALSGGGFRASLFHIGVLARLAELDVLRSVEVLSCVSGGSIIGAHYYLAVRDLLKSKPDADINREDYIRIVQNIERDFLAGVQRNLRMRVASDVVTNLKMILLPNYSRTERVGELFESEIFSRIEGVKNGPLFLNELRIQPVGAPSNFSPKVDNWRRAAKVPQLVLNATSLNTGHNWQFTVSWMGEPPSAINTEVDGNDRLRRLYYRQAPKPHDNIRLGHAVAASACVPGLFEPLALSNLYPERVVRLVDGGVHDNQGIGGLLAEDCRVMLVSDASGQMAALNNPGSGLFGVSLRSNSILMARVRDVEYRELEARLQSSLLRGLMFIHLKKGLEVDPIDWIDSDDPYDGGDGSHTADRRGSVTSYGVRKDIQESLAAVRTDLDSFSEKEAYALMLSGYRMAGHEFAESIKGFPPPPEDRPEWSFLTIERQMDRVKGFEDAHGDLMRSLNVGRSRAFKVWKLTPLLPAGFLLGCVALLAGGLWLYMKSSFVRKFVSIIRTTIITLAANAIAFVIGVVDVITALLITPLGAVIATLLLLALLIFGWRILQAIRRKKSLTQIAIGLGMASVGWIAAGVHLLLFDKLFLSQGRVKSRH